VSINVMFAMPTALMICFKPLGSMSDASYLSGNVANRRTTLGSNGATNKSNAPERGRRRYRALRPSETFPRTARR